MLLLRMQQCWFLTQTAAQAPSASPLATAPEARARLNARASLRAASAASSQLRSAYLRTTAKGVKRHKSCRAQRRSRGGLQGTFSRPAGSIAKRGAGRSARHAKGIPKKVCKTVQNGGGSHVWPYRVPSASPRALCTAAAADLASPSRPNARASRRQALMRVPLVRASSNSRSCPGGDAGY